MKINSEPANDDYIGLAGHICVYCDRAWLAATLLFWSLLLSITLTSTVAILSDWFWLVNDLSSFLAPTTTARDIAIWQEKLPERERERKIDTLDTEVWDRSANPDQTPFWPLTPKTSNPPRPSSIYPQSQVSENSMVLISMEFNLK